MNGARIVQRLLKNAKERQHKSVPYGQTEEEVSGEGEKGWIGTYNCW